MTGDEMSAPQAKAIPVAPHGVDAGPPPLSVKGLTYLYRDHHRASVGIEDVNFDVQPGQFVSVVGPSGCGKTTLLSIIAGLLTDYQGEVLVEGTPVRSPRREVGAVFQEESTFPWRTVRRNVEFGLQVRGVDRAERRRRADEMLELVGLASFGDAYPRQLSGGMKQRVAIARTLVTEPAVLLMDEPFGALDQQTRESLGAELLRIQTLLNQTIIFITHSIQEAVTLSDRVLVLHEKPGTVAEFVDIDLPKPRPENLIADPRFVEHVNRIWGYIRAKE
jgi:NitT/TauT family transport system ATP-binding protein